MVFEYLLNNSNCFWSSHLPFSAVGHLGSAKMSCRASEQFPMSKQLGFQGHEKLKYKTPTHIQICVISCADRYTVSISLESKMGLPSLRLSPSPNGQNCM